MLPMPASFRRLMYPFCRLSLYATPGREVDAPSSAALGLGEDAAEHVATGCSAHVQEHQHLSHFNLSHGREV